MKTPNKIVIANLRQNKKRTMATLIAVILSCTLLFAVGIAYSSYLQDDINDTAKNVGSYHVLYYDMDYEDTLSYLENANKTEDIYVMQQVSKFKKDYKDYQVLSYTELNPEIHISDGRDPQNDKEILVSSNVFYGLNLALGATFEGYSVVGVYDNRYILEEYPYANGLLKPNYISTLLTKKDLDKDNEHSCFFVTYKNIKKAYETMEIDAKNLGFELIDMNIQINNQFLEVNGVGVSSSTYAMRLLFLALGLYIISIFCMLIIYNAFAISLAERKKQFGTLRSIGTSKKTIIGMITKELLILSLIALPISFLLGVSIVFVALKVLDVLLNITIPITFNLLIILITIFFIFFSMVISAYTPGRKASKTSPMEAIRSTRDFKIKKSKRNYNLTKKIFGAEGQLARKNLKRNGKQFGTVVTSLTISMILFILVSTIVNFMTLEIRSFEVGDSSEYSDINIQIHYNDKKDAENILSKIEKMNYIDSMDVYKSSARAIVPEENSKYTDIAANSFTNYIIMIGMSKDELEQFAINNNLSIGKKYFINITNINKEDFDNKKPYQIFTNTDSITLCKYTNSGVVCDKEMNDVELIDHHLVIDDYNSEESYPALIMESKELETFIKENPGYVKDDKYFNVGIKSEKFKELDKEVLKIIDSYKDLSINYMNQPLDLYNQKRQILYIQIIIYAGIGFIGLISIVGLLNSINNNLNLREKEFAMLRSMGYSKKSLNKMITFENIFLISRSFIQALILTLIGFLALNYFIFYTNIDELSSAPIIYIPFPWVYTIIAFVAVILIILFLTSFSIKKIKNQNIIEAIRKDSI